MAKSRQAFVCQHCGAVYSKWQGQCTSCEEWNTLQAEVVVASGGAEARRASVRAEAAAVSTVAVDAVAEAPRFLTGIGEFDRVLGGGVVPGSVTLIGGDPGIGKSTLLLQAADGLAGAAAVLYASGEESTQQVAARARRLGLTQAGTRLIAETSVESILAAAIASDARLLIVDSIQTMSCEASDSAPGSVSQLRESTAQLVRFAKTRGAAVLLIGHVTKDGQIAGPRVLEHLVDTVLYFQSESGSRFRILRSVKNRFGAANEIGVFAMAEEGLREVKNPSAIFLSRQSEPVSGSAITVMREGSRSMLLEVQVLADDNNGPNQRRIAVGIDGNRLAMLLAVAHRHGGLALHGQDIFANVVGGVRLAETAGDLAIVMAARSSLFDKPIPDDCVIFGELGLAGEIRPVPFGEERVREAAKHGFKRALVPAANAPRKPPEGMQVIAAGRLSQALEALD